MGFIDEVELTVISGHGGPGAVSFRREKFIPFGGPDGGNGGKGGSIIIETNRNLNTLIHFRGKKVYNAENGHKGAGQQCDGANGEDLILQVPLGTTVKDVNTGEILADLVDKDQKVVLAEGGTGGHGNTYFKTAINRAPRFAQSGLPGKEFKIKFELKLLAHIGLVGFPNAGKSTLISVISAARPKIANYPFTTLIPNLGVVQVDDQSFVVADIPGLIEDANLGKGLGVKFLKHLERTNILVHLVDCARHQEPYDAFEDYVTIREELEKYNEELTQKLELVCLTKIDALTDEKVEEFRHFFKEQLHKEVLPISAVSGKNIESLKRLMLKAFLEIKVLLNKIN